VIEGRLAQLRACALALALVVMPMLSGHAGTVRLDDSGSYAIQPNVRMQWRSTMASPGSSAATEARVRVQIRIDTKAYAGQQGRVYMVLPLDAGPPLRAEWQTEGRLLAGSVLSGGRTLVYAGPLPGNALEDQLTVRLSSEVSWLSDSRRLNFHFELDLP